MFVDRRGVVTRPRQSIAARFAAFLSGSIAIRTADGRLIRTHCCVFPLPKLEKHSVTFPSA